LALATITSTVFYYFTIGWFGGANVGEKEKAKGKRRTQVKGILRRRTQVKGEIEVKSQKYYLTPQKEEIPNWNEQTAVMIFVSKLGRMISI
jgi:hypothetical protein